MTGLHVVRVDVHVQGVSFEKENSALMAGADKAVLEAGESQPRDRVKEEEKKPEEKKPEGKRQESKKQEEKKPVPADDLPEEPIAEVTPLEPAAAEEKETAEEARPEGMPEAASEE